GGRPRRGRRPRPGGPARRASDGPEKRRPRAVPRDEGPPPGVRSTDAVLARAGGCRPGPRRGPLRTARRRARGPRVRWPRRLPVSTAGVAVGPGKMVAEARRPGWRRQRGHRHGTGRVARLLAHLRGV